MAKSSKKRTAHPDKYDVKPDFAMDDFAPARPKKPKAETEGPEAVSVQDRLGANARGLLERLRQQMESDASENVASGKSAEKPLPRPEKAPFRAKSDKSRQDDAKPGDSDISFAEMFDPQPEDDTDFDTLLSDSKLDWREYK